MSTEENKDIRRGSSRSMSMTVPTDQVPPENVPRQRSLQPGRAPHQMGRGILTGFATLAIATGLVLLIGATTGWLDSFLGIGAHRSGASDLAVVTVEGKGKTVLIPSDGMAHWGPAWSPNDRRLVYTQGNPKTNVGPLVLAGAHGGGRFVLTRDGRNDYLAAWSPDSKRIAYITQQGQNESTAELAVINADGSHARTLTHNRAWEYGASWSPDGRWIAYGSEQGGSWHVWIVRPDGSGARILAGTEAGNAPDWSPDGRAIAFTSDRTGNDNIYLVPATGGTARRITAGPCHHDNARWSPDGSRIAFATYCAGGWNDIEVMNANGSHVVNLTNTPNLEEEVPSWLPDGRHIGFTLYRVERDSLWPAPAFKALGIGLVLGLIVTAALLMRALGAARRQATGGSTDNSSIQG